MSAVYDVRSYNRWQLVARHHPELAISPRSTKRRPVSRSRSRSSATRPTREPFWEKIRCAPTIQGSRFWPGTRTPGQWFDPRAFSSPAAYTFGNVGRNTLYGPGLQRWISRSAERFSPGTGTPSSPLGGIQWAEQGEFGNSQPLREHRAVRHHHGILHAWRGKYSSVRDSRSETGGDSLAVMVQIVAGTDPENFVLAAFVSSDPSPR